MQNGTIKLANPLKGWKTLMNDLLEGRLEGLLFYICLECLLFFYRRV